VKALEVQARNLVRVRWLVARHLQPDIGETSRTPTGRQARWKVVDGGRRESVAHDVRGNPGGGENPGGARSREDFTVDEATALPRKSNALKSGRTWLACGKPQRRRASIDTRARVRETGRGFCGRDKPLKGANPGRGSGAKQTRDSSGGVNRRGRAKRRGRTEAVTWVVAAFCGRRWNMSRRGRKPQERRFAQDRGWSPDRSWAREAGRGSWCSEGNGKLLGG